EIRGDPDWVTLPAREKDRTRRYESAGALAEDVRRHLDNEPVLARPPSTRYRVGKFVRKHRAGVAAAGVAAAALLVGLGAATAGWRRATEQTRVATRARNEADEQRLIAEQQRGAAMLATAVAV